MDMIAGHAIPESLRALLSTLLDPAHGPQWLLSLLAIALAWWLGRRWPVQTNDWRADLQRRLLRPGVIVVTALAGLLLLELMELPLQGLRLVAVLALAMVLIRAGLYLLHRTLHPGPLLAASEHLISALIWIAVALYLIGWLEPTLELLDAAAIQFGEIRVSILDLMGMLALAGLLLLLGTMLSHLVERRVMAVDDVSMTLRVGIAKVVRFSVVIIALLVALNLFGINLTSLAVFSGALGVGIGFGLQRIASNFISGFILLMDRSIRPGDVITIGDSFGVVKELNARYVVVRNRDGVEILIPNENLITSDVINWSYSDTSVRLKVPVQISYDDDPLEAMELLREVGCRHKRIQADPAPVVRLLGFGDSGINLELRVWITDPQDGVNNIRSELYVDIWKAFEQAGITIPYPQRDLHIKSQPR